MSKYETGKYVITLFDERGAKKEQFQLESEGLLAAQRLGHECIKEGRAHSFNVHRNVFNSMDAKGPW